MDIEVKSFDASREIRVCARGTSSDLWREMKERITQFINDQYPNIADTDETFCPLCGKSIGFIDPVTMKDKNIISGTGRCPEHGIVEVTFVFEKQFLCYWGKDYKGATPETVGISHFKKRKGYSEEAIESVHKMKVDDLLNLTEFPKGTHYVIRVM